MVHRAIIGFLLLLCLNVSFGDIIVPIGNQQVRWRQFLSGVSSSTFSRCMPYGTMYFVYDYDPEKKQFSWPNEYVVKKWMRIEAGEFKTCTEQEATNECSNSQSAQWCSNFNEVYTKCTTNLIANSQYPYVPYDCANADQTIAAYSIDFNSPYSEAYKRNEIGDYQPKNACGMNCGDPIQLNTGNSFQKIVDYTDPLGRGFDFVRYYNSLVSMNFGILPRGWTHSYLKSILIPGMGNSSTILFNDDGAMFQIAPNIDKKFKGYLDYTYDNNGNIKEYIIVYPDWGRETYSSAGKLMKIEKWSGATINVEYLPWPGYYNMVDDLGRKIEVQPGSLNFLLPNGANLMFDSNSNSFFLDGQIKDKGVYSDGRLASILNSSGVVSSSWTYDNSTKKGTQSIWNSGLSKQTITYTSDLTMTSVDEFGNTYSYVGRRVNDKTVLAQKTKTCASNANGCVNQNDVYEHDSLGNTIKHSNLFEQECFYYDQNDRLIKHVQGLALGVDCSGATGITFSYTWHPYMNRLTGVAGPNLIENITYGDNFMVVGKSVKTTNDATGVQGFLAPVTSTPMVETFTYNDKKLMTSHTVNGKSTTYFYSDKGFIVSMTGPDGLTYSYSNHTLDGLPKQVVTPSGLVVSLAYDGNNKLISMSTDEGESSTWTYLADGTLTQSSVNGVMTSYSYDANSRLTSIQNSLSSLSWMYTGNSLYPSANVLSSQGKNFQTSVQYNELGQPVVVSK